MSKLRETLIKELTKDGGWPSLVYDGINIRDMERDDLELLCILLGHQCLLKKPIIEVLLKETKNERRKQV